MVNQSENPSSSPRRVNIWIIISGIGIVLIIVVGYVFYSAVRNNISTLKNKNQSTTLRIATNDDPYAGSVDAKIVIVEFSDFQCPFCFQSFPVVREVINTYRDQIRFIYRDFPIVDIHPQAPKAAEAGECADDQGKFWEMHDKIFINQDDLSVISLKQYASELGLDTTAFNECLDSGKYTAEVQEDFSDGLLAGVDGTPTFFINDRKFEGVMSIDTFKTIIDELIAIYSK